MIRERVYLVLCLVLCILPVVSNLTYQKFVSLNFFDIHVFEISVGVLYYPFSFLIADIISEFYGKDKASFCIKATVFVNLLVSLMIFYMDKLPATQFSKVDDQIFHSVFGFFAASFLASMISCYLSQEIDVRLYIFLKRIANNKYLWFRNTFSSAFSLFVDSFLVISSLKYFGALPDVDLWTLLANNYSWKLFLTIASIPVLYIVYFTVKYFLKEGVNYE